MTLGATVALTTTPYKAGRVTNKSHTHKSSKQCACLSYKGEKIAQLVKVLGAPGDTGMNPVTAITFSCVPIHCV